MTRRITAAAVASLAALALTSVATAQAATPYRASLAPVDLAATTAGLATVTGQAQLVDGSKNNKINLHVRNLAPGATYLWHVHVGSCPVPGLPVAGWTYRTQDAEGNGTLTANPAGNANTKATSATFDADPTLSYSVAVQLATPTNGVPAGTIIACGDLTPNKAAGLGVAAGVHVTGGNGKHPQHAKGPKS